MLLCIMLTLCILLVILEFMGVNSIKYKFLFAIPLFMLWVLFSFNRFNSDYLDYSNLFVDIDSIFNFEFGYGLLVKLFSVLGLDHDYIIFTVGSFLCVLIALKTKNERYASVVLLMYSLSVLYFDLNQIRNTIMYLMVIVALRYVELKKPVKYYIIICLAFLFHKFSLVYLPFYYLSRIKRNHFLFLLILCVVIIFAFSPIIIQLLTIMLPSKMTAYLSREPGFGVLIVFVYVLIDVFTIWWVDKKIKYKVNGNDKEKMEIMYRFIWLSVLILPFSLYFLEVKRMQRNAMLIKFIYGAFAMKYMGGRDRFLLFLLLLFSSALPLLVMFYNGEIASLGDIDENFILYFIGFSGREEL